MTHTNNSQTANNILDESLNMEDGEEVNLEKAEEILESLGLLEDDDN